MRIYKILPGGRTVERDVTEQEYAQQGWADQGWAAPPAVQRRVEAQTEQAFRDEFQNTDINYLAGLARNWRIIKKLPNGKYASRTVTGGEYTYGGWRDNGWYIPSYQQTHSKPVSDTQIERDKLIDAIMQKNWWRPKRSYSQAHSYYAGHMNTIGNELGHNAAEDIAKIQARTHTTNPKWTYWLRRGTKWLFHNRPKALRKALSFHGPQYRQAIRPLFMEYAKNHKAPPKVIPIKRKRIGFVYTRR